MTYIVIPAHLWPATALDLYRLTMWVKPGQRVRITDVRDGLVYWEAIP